MENSLAVLKILNMQLPYNPGTDLLSINPREMKIYVHPKTCMQIFTTALFIMMKDWKQPKGPSASEWIKYGIHTAEHYSATKNELLIQAPKGMTLKCIFLSEISHTKGYILHHSLYVTIRKGQTTGTEN